MTVMRILQRRPVLSLEFLHYLACHFSCNMVVTTVNKPGAHRSTSTALSLSRHLCQEIPAERQQGLLSRCFLSAGSGRQSLWPQSVTHPASCCYWRVANLPRGYDTMSENNFSIPDKLHHVHFRVPLRAQNFFYLFISKNINPYLHSINTNTFLEGLKCPVYVKRTET